MFRAGCALRTWSRQLAEQSAPCSCFSEISRQRVCPVTAAQQTSLGRKSCILWLRRAGACVPRLCPKATGHGAGGLVREQEEEGVPTPLG